ncbi:hypothetical protein [Phycobacter sp. K97]|uniref:hypothetical protein n=1 Tax=Phycobacter sedimenti TaxID=3133977 RepID=UPI00311D503B
MSGSKSEVNERRLFLHVGTHKTGTTSFQAALCSMAPQLRRTGFEVLHGKPIARKGSANAFLLANCFIRPSLKTSPRLLRNAPLPDEANTNRVMAGLTKMVEASTARDFVISSEEFCLLRTPEEATLLRHHLTPLFSEIVPILCLRSKEAWAASRENQLKKTSVTPLLEEVSDAESTNGSWYYQTDELRAFWEGIGDLIVIDYDAVLQRDGSVFPALFGAIGQTPPDTSKEWLNRRDTFASRMRRNLSNIKQRLLG